MREEKKKGGPKKNIEMRRRRRIYVLPHKFAFKPDWNLCRVPRC